MHQRMLFWTLALVGLALTGHTASAQVTTDYRFFDNAGVALPANPQIPQGTTITWRVYLVDRAGASTLSANGGISGAGVSVSSSAPTIVSVNSTPPPPGALQSTTPTGISNPGWTGGWNNSGSTTNNIHLAVTGGFIAGVQPDTPTAGKTLIGTYTFTASTTAFGPATITASDPFPQSNSDNALFTPPVGNPSGGFDNQIASGTQALTITAVPEPGSMMLCGLGAVGLAAYRRRTRKTTPVEAVA